MFAHKFKIVFENTGAVHSAGIAADAEMNVLKGPLGFCAPGPMRLAPLQKWINQNTDLLFGAESRGK